MESCAGCLGPYTPDMARRLAAGRGRLLERDEELARVEQAIAALRGGHGGALVIQGAAGIGKSALLRAVSERSAVQGVQTLIARGSELERDFGFGVVRPLLETHVVRVGESERAELLAGEAGRSGAGPGRRERGGFVRRVA